MDTSSYPPLHPTGNFLQFYPSKEVLRLKFSKSANFSSNLANQRDSYSLSKLYGSLPPDQKKFLESYMQGLDNISHAHAGNPPVFISRFEESTQDYLYESTEINKYNSARLKTLIVELGQW